MSAPRSQRVSKRSSCEPCLKPSRTSAAARPSGELSGATFRTAQTKFSERLVHSTVFTPRLSRRSSPRKSEQILAAFDEQPASFSRSA